MPGYITNLLTRLKHPPPKHKVDAPHQWTVPRYGNHPQYAPTIDITPLLPPTETVILQLTVGSLLFYARAVDDAMGDD